MKTCRLYLSLTLALAMFPASGLSKTIDITVSNPTGNARTGEIVELKACELLKGSDDRYLYITDSNNEEIPSQVTYDSLFIFSASAPASGTATYTIHTSTTPHTYLPIATGKTRPERQDDLSWENNLVGFRAYGPATRKKGEKAFGYDIFFKHPTPTPVLDILYDMQTSAANWAKVDSLKKSTLGEQKLSRS